MQKISTPDEQSKELFGKWTYKSDSGGFSGAGGSKQFNENSWVEFTNKGVYKVYEGSKCKDRYRFNLEKQEGYTHYLIRFNGNGLLDYRYTVTVDTLYLSENVADGFSYMFVRKN